MLTFVFAALLGFIPCAIALATAEGQSMVEIEEGVPGGVAVTILKVSAEVVTGYLFISFSLLLGEVLERGWLENLAPCW